jgi:succinate dehydrogenase / fumarate reductase, cytochrome b subunit
MTTRPRPLSPHLSIYRFTLTMTMSIVHRITGVALYVGTLLLVIWLGAIAFGGPAFDVVQAGFGSWFGQLVLFGYTWALFHHALGGIRHFIWDTGTGLAYPAREWFARINLAGSIVLTLAAWSFFVWFKW